MASLQSRFLSSSSLDLCKTISPPQRIPGSGLRFRENDDTHIKLSSSRKTIPSWKMEGSRIPIETHPEDIVAGNDTDILFSNMKQNFLSFKKNIYLKNMEESQKLAEAQEPKFMIIACADSRVCPSSILGLKSGDAFMVRQVANLVPPFEDGPTETNAALEFAVNALEVPNILVIGHSRCGGIRALMSMPDEADSRSFIRSWVKVGKKARHSTKSAASDLGFDQQCQHCEKESVNFSLLNLLSYPWIEEKVAKGVLSLHGGYYDFVNCTFERWTLDCKGKDLKNEECRHSVKSREFWS